MNHSLRIVVLVFISLCFVVGFILYTSQTKNQKTTAVLDTSLSTETQVESNSLENMNTASTNPQSQASELANETVTAPTKISINQESKVTPVEDPNQSTAVASVTLLDSDDLETKYKKALTAQDATEDQRLKMEEAIKAASVAVAGGNREDIKNVLGYDSLPADKKAEFDSMTEEEFEQLVPMLEFTLEASLSTVQDTDTYYIKILSKTPVGVYKVAFIEKQPENNRGVMLYSIMQASFKEVGGDWMFGG